MSDDPRRQTARATGEALDAARGRLLDAATLAGFDGFVDSIIDVVQRREAPGAGGYERMRTIASLADRIGQAAGRSANIELVVKRVKAGGNGPLMAGAMASLGAPVTYIGSIGSADGPAPHPVFESFVRRCTDVRVLGAPGFTDALEFDDGKLMLGKLDALSGVSWDAVVGAADGLDGLRAMAARSRVLAMCNWTMLHEMPAIWDGLLHNVLNHLPEDAAPPAVFVDLADPAKRSDEDVLAAVEQLQRLNALAPVTLGLNLAESARVLRLYREGRRDDLAGAAEAVHRSAGLACVIVHSRHGAAAAEAGDTTSFAGPFVREPVISTGAGDHFNGGFAFAQALGLPLEHRLAAGVAVSGHYVRNAEAPTLDELVEFLRDLPDPERE